MRARVGEKADNILPSGKGTVIDMANYSHEEAKSPECMLANPECKAYMASQLLSVRPCGASRDSTVEQGAGSGRRSINLCNPITELHSNLTSSEDHYRLDPLVMISVEE